MSTNDQASNVELAEKIKISSNYVWKNLQYKESLIRQKSMQKWVREGDIKTRYFHSVMN